MDKTFKQTMEGIEHIQLQIEQLQQLCRILYCGVERFNYETKDVSLPPSPPSAAALKFLNCKNVEFTQNNNVKSSSYPLLTLNLTYSRGF
jgi:hypothetical protein